MRGIFFEEGDARAVVARLAAAGYAARAGRDRLAGEDDDEDHPWAVVTDAPEFELDLLVDEFEGWLEFDETDAPPAPLALPTEPRKIKRPSGG